MCEACTLGKQIRSSLKPKQVISSTQSLDLIHIDLCGPMRVQSRGGKRYVFVLVDDYTRYTCTLFLTSKDDAFEVFCSLIRRLQKKFEKQLMTIKSDHGTQFENSIFVNIVMSMELLIIFLPPEPLNKTIWLKERTQLCRKWLEP